MTTYDQWKDPTEYWTPPDVGEPSDDDILDAAIAERRTTPDETHDAVLDLLSLIQAVANRDDCPEIIKNALLRDQRHLDARQVAIAYL